MRCLISFIDRKLYVSFGIIHDSGADHQSFIVFLSGFNQHLFRGIACHIHISDGECDILIIYLVFDCYGVLLCLFFRFFQHESCVCFQGFNVITVCLCCLDHCRM